MSFRWGKATRPPTVELPHCKVSCNVSLTPDSYFCAGASVSTRMEPSERQLLEEEIASEKSRTEAAKARTEVLEHRLTMLEAQAVFDEVKASAGGVSDGASTIVDARGLDPTRE